MKVATIKFMFTGIRAKLIIAFLAVILITTVIIGRLIYQEDRFEFESMLGLRLQSMAASGALLIDGDKHDDILPAEDGDVVGTYTDRHAAGTDPAVRGTGREIRLWGAEEFLSIREKLRSLKNANELATNIYTLRRSQTEGQMEFVVMTDDEPYTGNLYPSNSGIEKVFATSRPSCSPLYEDQHGLWISAYAPIMNSDSLVVGVLEIDYEASELTRKLTARLRTLILISALAMILAVFVALLLARKITKPILQLSDSMRTIRDGNLTVRTEIRTHDELEEAGSIFNEMAEGLQAKQQLLTYVSKAAWIAAHKRAEMKTSEMHGEKKNVTMLFSDIKGFTPMSTRKSAAEVVEILNDYFSKMTLIIARNNGSIDKFIGDAIMAIFEEGDDHGAMSAAVAGIEMQRCLMEKPGIEPLSIRIGIHTGEVVKGDIGSIDVRLDYTVIGDNVNRTQRLESNCTPGHVLLSSETHELVRHRIKAASRGRTSLKGVAETVETFEIDPVDPYV